VRPAVTPFDQIKALLGYRVHTNYELGMMLRREKPLAVFSEVNLISFPPLHRYLRMFDRHVSAGRFVKREHTEQIDEALGRSANHISMVYYALPDEAWRINAMIELRTKLHSKVQAWTTADERAEGLLLGYTAMQNDAWIKHRYSAAH
jgi:hypothetical protein